MDLTIVDKQLLERLNGINARLIFSNYSDLI